MDRVDDDVANGGRGGRELVRGRVGRRGETEAEVPDRPKRRSYWLSGEVVVVVVLGVAEEAAVLNKEDA